MKTLVCATLACTLWTATPSMATGQTPSSPNLVFTIHGGATMGHSLWAVNRQPLCVTDPQSGTCASGSPYDTVRIARTVGSGISAGLSVAYYPGGAHLGYYGDVSFVGLSLEDGCTGLYFTAGPGSTNDILCQTITGNAVNMGAVAFTAGLTMRASAFGITTPFFRAGAGVLSFSQSTLDMSALVINNGLPELLSVVVDNSPNHLSPVITFGAGVRMAASPGYGVRLEIADLIARFQRLEGPVNTLGQGPVGSRYYHHLTAYIGLDIVLEKKRGRRY